jgi:serine/threonine protein kinase
MHDDSPPTPSFIPPASDGTPMPPDERLANTLSVPAGRPPLIAGFQILGELGRGGMGIVYHARDPKLQREVALKMMRPGGFATPEHRARFLAEAVAVAKLRHPHVVPIHAVVEHAGLPVLVLEYVAGAASTGTSAATPSRTATRPNSCCSWPGRSTMRISRASSTATSSRPTSCSPRPPMSRP